MSFKVIFFIISFFGGATCGQTKIVELTWDFDNKTNVWPSNQKFVFTRRVGNKDNGYWYAINDFCTGEHSGTHFDSPYHFNENGWKVGDVPVYRLVAKGALIDLRTKTKISGSRTLLEVQDLEDWQTKNGQFENGTVLLVQFGWSKYWYNRTEYMGLINDKLNFPGISEEAIRWIVDTRKFYGVGLDTLSLDPGSSTTFPVHRILFENQMYGLENVKLTEILPAKGFTLLVMPMLIKEGTGAPLRLMAVIPKNIV